MEADQFFVLAVGVNERLGDHGVEVLVRQTLHCVVLPCEISSWPERGVWVMQRDLVEVLARPLGHVAPEPVRALPARPGQRRGPVLTARSWAAPTGSGCLRRRHGEKPSDCRIDNR
jgi:hypothetical protein